MRPLGQELLSFLFCPLLDTEEIAQGAEGVSQMRTAPGSALSSHSLRPTQLKTFSPAEFLGALMSVLVPGPSTDIAMCLRVLFSPSD